MKYLKNKLTYKNILLLIYVIITFIITINHEPWRDEAQSWLIAKNLNIIDIIKQMKYEGHPCLWHLFLYPFTRLNFPYKYINIISWLIGCISTGIIIKKSPFSNYTTTALILSTPILYYYVVLSRSYCLVLFFIATLLHFYQNRKKRPILYGINLALLTNTHILICPLVGFLMLKHFYELITDKTNLKPKIISFIIQILGVILLILQLATSLSNNAETGYIISANLFESLILLLKVMVNDNPILFITIFFSLISIIFVLFKQKFIFIATITTLLFFILINIYIYTLGTQHIGIIILSILFYSYMYIKEHPKNKLLEISLLIFFLSTIPYSLELSIKDITNKFTNSKDVATYITNNIPKNTTFLCVTDDKVLSIVPYLDKNYKFISHYTKKEFTYITWSNERHINPNIFIIEPIIRTKNIKYIINSTKNTNYELKNLKEQKILKTIATFDEENIIKNYLEKYEILEVIKE